MGEVHSVESLFWMDPDDNQMHIERASNSNESMNYALLGDVE